jgi:hypothetical protein
MSYRDKMYVEHIRNKTEECVEFYFTSNVVPVLLPGDNNRLFHNDHDSRRWIADGFSR